MAKLAQLKLEPSEEAYYQEKFKGIPDDIGKISEVELGKDMLEKDESLQKIYHQDATNPSDVYPDQFSPHMEGRFFKVPKVIE